MVSALGAERKLWATLTSSLAILQAQLDVIKHGQTESQLDAICASQSVVANELNQRLFKNANIKSL